jgi:hypothetical protein
MGLEVTRNGHTVTGSRFKRGSNPIGRGGEMVGYMLRCTCGWTSKSNEPKDTSESRAREHLRYAHCEVYGWTPMAAGGQVRAICAAESFAAASRASEAAGLGKIRRDYCSETAVPEELKVAHARPGVVFTKGLNDHQGEFAECKRC